MHISDSEEKFKPTVEWMSEKYDELNEWLFNGRLRECKFEIYSKGFKTNSLGHFRFLGQNIGRRRRDGRLVCTIMGEQIELNYDNLVEYADPVIGLNGLYKRTEKAWLNTLVHEMCHYYTYEDGWCPKQAHGTEFRRIAEHVGAKSNGIFSITRLTKAEEDTEIDSEIAEKRKKRDDNKKSKMKAILIYLKNGDVQLITTTSESLIRLILKDIHKDSCKKIIQIDTNEFIEFLWSKGYKHNMKSYRYWNVANTPVVSEAENYPSEILFKNNTLNEIYTITMEDIKLMTEAVINKLLNDSEIVPITPETILSQDF